MKKAVFFSVFILLISCITLTSCSTESDSNIPSDENNEDPSNDPTLSTFTFTFNVNITINNGPLRFVISDEAGSVLGEGIVDSNQQTQITVTAPENTVFDLTSVSEEVFQNGYVRRDIRVTQGIEPGTYNVNGNSIYNPGFSSVLLSITNMGTPGIKRPSHGETNFFGNYSPDNGGTINFDGSAYMFDGFGGYYMSFIRNDDTEERYYWSEDPPTTSPEVIDYFSLPVQDNFITLSTPQDFTSSSQLQIQGYHPNNTTIRGNSVAVRDSQSSLPQLTYGLPTGIFNRFRMDSQHVRGEDRFYRIIKTQSAPFTAIPISDLNMTVSSQSLSSFNAQIEGNGDVYTIRYEYEDSQANMGYTLEVSGQPQPNISFSKSALLNNVLDGAISPSSLQLEYVTISDYEDVSSFLDFINASFEGSIVLIQDSMNYTNFTKLF